MPRSVARSVFHRRIVAIFYIGVRLFAAVMTLALNAADARVVNHSARTHAIDRGIPILPRPTRLPRHEPSETDLIRASVRAYQPTERVASPHPS